MTHPQAVTPELLADQEELVGIIARALAAKQIDAVNERVGLGLMGIGKDHRDAMIERDYSGWIDDARYVADAITAWNTRHRLSASASVSVVPEANRRAFDLLARMARRQPWQEHYGHTWEQEAADILALTTTPAPAHTDDFAVDTFAAKMKAKLARAREKGRGGWDDPQQCSPEKLSAMLHDHVAKGDPVDVANFAMMIEHYGASICAAGVRRGRVKCDRPGCDWADGCAFSSPALTHSDGDAI